MARETQPNPVSRRSFLRNAALTAVAATAAGTGVAALSQRAQDKPIIIEVSQQPLSAALTAGQTAVAPNINDSADLLARLAGAQAENVRLQAALDAAQRELESLRQHNQNSSAAGEALTLQLDDAQERLGVLAGLVALYEQLDDVDLGSALQDGLATVNGAIADLLSRAPTLSAGIDAGNLALAEVEAHLPLLQNGRAWLTNHLERVRAFYSSVEVVLQSFVDNVGPFLQMLEEWFREIRKWLPFGLGQRAADVMAALTRLVAETPNTLSGLETNVAQPLDVWLARGDGDGPRLQRTLVKPLREQVLGPARQTVVQAEQVQTVYRERLAAPLETAVAQRRAMREQIGAYRQQHQV